MNKKFLSLVAGLALPLLMSTATTYAVSQSGPNPIVFNQKDTADNLMVLTAAGSAHNDEVTVDVSSLSTPKYAWVNNFGQGRTGDWLQWSISLDTAATYRVYALLKSGGYLPMKIVNGDQTLYFTTNNIGWDKLDCGTISLPAGASNLQLFKNTSDANAYCYIKSIELIRESHRSAYEARVAKFKQSSLWFADCGYGLFFQYGAWGYPQYGGRKSLDQGAADFNVSNFVTTVKSTGAKYIIWSISWYEYKFQMPNNALDSIMGNGNFTSSRNLIGDVAQACQDNGIKFFLYYHTGLNQEPDWLAKQNWPANSEFTNRATGDRSTFFNNWCAVVSEVGDRLGTNLDGWFFDDGNNYYPAPFERLGVATKKGNPNRLISYNNNMGVPRLTDFQDLTFGENEHGEEQYASASVGSNGIIWAGPQKGLLQHGMFLVDDDWGIHNQNQSISQTLSSSTAASWISTAKTRRIPLSFTLCMYEDGTMANASKDVIYNGVLNYANFSKSAATGYNDNQNSSFWYSGASWGYSSGRGLGDWGDDVHYATSNGDFVQQSFVGTGFDVGGEKNSDQGNIDIYCDGVYQTTVNTYNASRLTNQTFYSKSGLAKGSHTLKVIKASGSYMIFDWTVIKDSTFNSVAQGKTATQVSTVYDGFASRAVDGNIDGNWSNNSVTHTNTNNNDWLIINLGGFYNIDQVEIYNRTDACTDRLANYNTRLGYDGGAWPISQYFYGCSALPMSHDFRGQKASYVCVQLTGTVPLSLAEVKVYGSPVSNLASNSDFESGAKSPWNYLSNSSATIAGSNMRAGTYCMKLSGSGVSEAQHITGLTANTKYSFSGYIKSSAGNTISISAKNYGGDVCKSADVESSSYTFVSVDFTTGASSTSADLYLTKSAGSGDGYFDDMILVKK